MQQNYSYDHRQFERLGRLVTDFQRGAVSFSRLVSDGEALILSMESVSNETRNKLLSVWGVLDEIYAFVLDQERNRLNAEEEMEVRRAAQRLQEIVAARQEDSGNL